MTEAVIREQLVEINELILKLNQEENDNPETFEGLYISQNDMKTDAVIDELRMHIMYLMFDLEASHRENRYLRQMLEMRPPRTRGGEEG